MAAPGDPDAVNATADKAIAVSVVEFLEYEDWEQVIIVSMCTCETACALIELQHKIALVAELQEADRGTCPLG